MASIMSDFYATSLPCISSKSILDAQNAMKSIANQDGLDRLLASNADVKALYEIPSAHDTIDAVISSGAGGWEETCLVPRRDADRVRIR